LKKKLFGNTIPFTNLEKIKLNGQLEPIIISQKSNFNKERKKNWGRKNVKP